MTTPKRPNILLVWTDQQRNDSLPCMGNDIIKAPHLKRLGEQSFVFRHALCSQPVCTPSRASILTGRWPHSHGCVTNNIPLGEDSPTLAEMLPEAYDCAYYGKWHLGDELNAQKGFSDWRSIEDGIYRDYYFDEVDLERRSSYHDFLIREGFPPDFVDEKGNELFSREFAAGLAEPYTKATYLAAEAERFLLDRKGKEQPFFLSVSMLEPHPPTFGPFNGMHDPDTIPVDASFMVESENESRRIKRIKERLKRTGYKRHPLQTESDWRRLKCNYHGLVSLVDQAFGRIRRALETSGEAENTIVVFTSDHGDMMGDHGLLQKGYFYEQAVRVPLLIYVPWLSTKQVMLDGPVSQVDLVPTLLDLAGATIPNSVQGVSRAAVLRDLGDSMIAEEGSLLGGDVVVEWNDPDHPAEEGRSLVSSDGWKMNAYRDDRAELFDLNEDPCELENLARETEHDARLLRMGDRLGAWQIRYGDTMELVAEL